MKQKNLNGCLLNVWLMDICEFWKLKYFALLNLLSFNIRTCFYVVESVEFQRTQN